jgi:hypothetical protein
MQGPLMGGERMTPPPPYPQLADQSRAAISRDLAPTRGQKVRECFGRDQFVDDWIQDGDTGNGLF